MPRARKHPDAIPAEVASEWLEEAAAFLAGDDGHGLSPDARDYVISYLKAAAAGKPLRQKTAAAAAESRAWEAAHRVHELYASEAVTTHAEAFRLAAEQMGLDPGGGPDTVRDYCKQVWKAMNPYPPATGERIEKPFGPVSATELREWFEQAFAHPQKSNKDD